MPQASGASNDTLIVYTADNGAPWASGKTTFYEPGAGVPMIISVPGAQGEWGAARRLAGRPRRRAFLSGGARSTVLASLLDIAPTILDWMGVPFVPYPLNGHNVNLRGKSLLPFVVRGRVGSAGPGSFTHAARSLR